MDFLLTLAHALIRFIRLVRRHIKIFDLRLRGVVIDGSAHIDPGAIIEPSGGKIVIGARTFIDRGVVVRPLGGYIQIGSDCSVNAYSVLYGGGGLKIGDDVRIAAHTVIVPSNHIFSDPDTPIRNQGLHQEGIVIEGDVWIGAGAQVLDGVVLGKGCVVGAGAVVTRSVKPHAVVAGVPATPISSRLGQDT